MLHKVLSVLHLSVLVCVVIPINEGLLGPMNRLWQTSASIALASKWNNWWYWVLATGDKQFSSLLMLGVTGSDGGE